MEEDASWRARWARRPGSTASALAQHGRPRPSRRACGCSRPRSRGARWSTCGSAAGRRPRPWWRSGSWPPPSSCWAPPRGQRPRGLAPGGRRAHAACTSSPTGLLEPCLRKAKCNGSHLPEVLGKEPPLPPLYSTRPAGRSHRALP